MPHLNARSWQPGTDFPYVARLDERRLLAIVLPARWVRPGRGGEPLLLPEGVRAIDRLRAVLSESPPATPGAIVSLREALGLTQSEFARRLGVSKMTVSRWECGRMRPGTAALARLHRMKAAARRKGIAVDGGSVRGRPSPLRAA